MTRRFPPSAYASAYLFGAHTTTGIAAVVLYAQRCSPVSELKISRPVPANMTTSLDTITTRITIWMRTHLPHSRLLGRDHPRRNLETIVRLYQLAIRKGGHILRLRTGPIILVAVLTQFHSPVSQSEISESVPPVARYRLNGCSSIAIQDEV